MSREAVLQLLLSEAHDGVRGRWCCSGAGGASSACCRSARRCLRPDATVCHCSTDSGGSGSQALSLRAAAVAGEALRPPGGRPEWSPGSLSASLAPGGVSPPAEPAPLDWAEAAAAATAAVTAPAAGSASLGPASGTLAGSAALSARRAFLAFLRAALVAAAAAEAFLPPASPSFSKLASSAAYKCSATPLSAPRQADLHICIVSRRNTMVQSFRMHIRAEFGHTSRFIQATGQTADLVGV